MSKEQAKEIKKDIGKYSALEALKNSEGGEILVDSLLQDMASCIDEIAGKYKTSTHIELIAIGAKLSERLVMYRTLTRSTKNKKLASEALKEILKEED